MLKQTISRERERRAALEASMHRLEESHAAEAAAAEREARRWKERALAAEMFSGSLISGVDSPVLGGTSTVLEKASDANDADDTNHTNGTNPKGPANTPRGSTATSPSPREASEYTVSLRLGRSSTPPVASPLVGARPVLLDEANQQGMVVIHELREASNEG